MRLKPKLLSLLIPLLLVPLLGVSWAAYLQLRDQAEERVERQLSMQLEQLRMNIQSLMAHASANLELFANSDEIQAYLLNDNESDRYLLLQPSLLRLLGTYQAAYPEYYEIRLVLPDGFEDTRAVKGEIDNLTEDEASSEVFKALSTSPDGTMLKFATNPDDGRYVLYAGKAIKLRRADEDPLVTEPRLRGYLMLTVDTAGLMHNSSKAQATVSEQIFGIDSSGVIRIHGDRAKIGESLPPDVLAGVKAVSQTGAEYISLQDGEERHYHAVNANNDIWLVSAYQEREFGAGATRLAQVVAGISLVAVLVMAAFAYWFMNTMFIRPVHELRRATRQVSEGNMSLDLKADSKDEIGDLARAFLDMGENLHASQEQIRFHAFHDNLTGLPNRFMFREHLEREVSSARHHHENVGVLFADVDGFKRINDTLGHHAGDDLLQQISGRIRSMVRQQDVLGATTDLGEMASVVSRIGGDEFVILISHLKHAVEASRVAQRIINAISRPFEISGQEVFIGVSIGIALYPADADNAEDLLKHADMAMFHAKAAGKNNYQFYSRLMSAVATNSLSLEASLHRAMERDELYMVYQPKIDLRSGRTVGVEALIRWNHPEQGMIPPSTFIPVAEEVGMINTIGEWTLMTVCRQLREWEGTPAAALVAAVNISSQQLVNQQFGATVHRVLRDSGVQVDRLEFEMTETAVMQMGEHIDAVFHLIRELGIAISLDDFGTGYSSLSHLRRFPIDFLKIDRSFVDEATSNPDDLAIVSAIILMARSLGLQVVAEGVETAEQVALLRAKGCEFAQGYYFGRPMSAEDILERMRVENEVGLHDTVETGVARLSN